MKVAVIFGGKSCEHNISVITGVQVMQAIAPAHKVIPIYIDNSGKWLTANNLIDINIYKHKEKIKGKEVHFCPSSHFLYSAKGKKLAKIDVAVLANHGVNGEDGSLQGVLQLSGIPYTCSNVLGSSVGMDKITMKRVFAACKLPIIDYCAVFSEEFKEKPDIIISELVTKLGFPLIIKPSNLGSSIGISIAKDPFELSSSLQTAFSWDNRVLVEKALSGFTELNCAVLTREKELITSEVEQPVGWKEFLTYEDKYIAKTTGRKMPAEISPKIRKQVEKYAKAAYLAVGAGGVARIDFLLLGEKLYVNEINTIPGALSNYLFKPLGIEFSELIEILIAEAISAFKERERLKYVFTASVGGFRK